MIRAWRVLCAPCRAFWRLTAPLREPETDPAPKMGWRTMV